MIRLREAILVRFGKFQDFHLKFSDGLQVIYGENEAGKSTIQLFLKVMLYGIVGSKKDNKGIKIRERIIPWEEKSAEGVLRLDLDGRIVEIRRKFGKTASGDKTEVVDFHTGEAINDYDLKVLGEQLLGFPETVFEKTLWLQQSGAAFSGADDTINRRLLNLLETGAEEFSTDEVLKKLESEKRVIKAKDKRSTPGELDLLWKLREEKIQERYQLLSTQRQRAVEEQLLNKANQSLERLKEEEVRLQELLKRKQKFVEMDSLRKRWEEGEKLLTLAEQAEQRDAHQRFYDLDETVVQNAENLEKRREILDQTEAIEYDIKKEDKVVLQKKKEEKWFSILLAFGAAFVVLAVVLAVIRNGYWEILTFFSGGVGLSLDVLGFIKLHQSRNAAWQASERKKELQITLRSLQAEAGAIEKEYRKILNNYGCKNVAELREGFMLCKQAKLEAEGYRRTYESLMDGEDISAQIQEINLVLAKNADIIALDVEGELHKVRQEQIACISKIKETESKLSYVFQGGLNPADTETEICQINQKIEQLEKRQTALNLAIEVFDSVAERRKSDFTPKINEKVNYFLDILTDGKYQDVRVSKEYQLKLLPDKTHLYQAEFFSTGTYEQIYFALRLSLVALLGEGTEPFFLDDFLTSYDDNRAGLAMDLLLELANEHQILFFSCHNREVENAKKRNVIIQYLEEERNDGC